MKRFRRGLSFHDNAIEAKAAAWLAERDDSLTPEAAAEFARWRRADQRHETAVALLESTWSALQQLRNLPANVRIQTLLCFARPSKSGPGRPQAAV